MVQIAAVQEAVRRRFGAQLQNIERWGGFRADETTEEWIHFLGLTAVVLTHQEHLVQVVDKLLRNDPSVSDADKYLLMLAFSIHDVGEISVGDTANPEKTEKSEQVEWVAALNLLRLLAPDIEDGQELTNIYMDVVVGDNAVLHSLFKAIERTEYFMTAMNGFRYLIDSGDRSPNKWRLVARVLAFDLPVVISLGRQYPHSIGAFLRSEKDFISQMLVGTEHAVMEHYRPNYETAKSDWSYFLSS